jgi:hypothetical protein
MKRRDSPAANTAPPNPSFQAAHLLSFFSPSTDMAPGSRGYALTDAKVTHEVTHRWQSSREKGGRNQVCDVQDRYMQRSNDSIPAAMGEWFRLGVRSAP